MFLFSPCSCILRQPQNLSGHQPWSANNIWIEGRFNVMKYFFQLYIDLMLLNFWEVLAIIGQKLSVVEGFPSFNRCYCRALTHTIVFPKNSEKKNYRLEKKKLPMGPQSHALFRAETCIYYIILIVNLLSIQHLRLNAAQR